MELIVVLTVLALAVLVALWWFAQGRDSTRVPPGAEPPEEPALGEHPAPPPAPAIRPGDLAGVTGMELRPLGRVAHHQLFEQWASVHAMFEEDPYGAVDQADLLFADVLRARGARLEDLELRPLEIASTHPGLVERYHEAHDIAVTSRNSEVDADRLGRAFADYRALFVDLLAPPAEVHAEAAGAPARRPS